MRRLVTLLLAVLAVLSAASTVEARKVPDIKNTKHNLSASGPGPLRATNESQICVFCHTPHAAENIVGAPLWNRKLSNATYDGTGANTYRSASIDASLSELAAGPGGLSRLCLSCHDGTMAIGSVNVLNGKANQTITMTLSPSTMPTGSGVSTGFTRNLGVDLSNDHPISFTYSETVALADGELRTPDGAVIGTRTIGQQVKPKLPLEDGKMQCTTCHDPHLKEDDVATNGVAKFLRLNRLQKDRPGGGLFSETGDIICLACHNKAGSEWAQSAHANPDVADEKYRNDANIAGLREFPNDLPVWKAACLNCHDTHTVQGARRLLREGTDGAGTPKSGGGSAIEETCYQCHSGSGSVLQNVTQVPDIKTEFGRTSHMPITTLDQKAAREMHDIGTGDDTEHGTRRGKDFFESPTLLGKSVGNRHVECTDCHNPHRVAKSRLFNGSDANEAAGTHNHAAPHSNLASGVLRGSYGVEPSYSAASFGTTATFTIKRGVPGISTLASAAYVTREYQVCLKCHSSYAYDSPPALGWSGGGTASNRTGFDNYTDQAMEFQAPGNHQGRASQSDSGAFTGGTVRRGCTATNNTCGANGCTCATTNATTLNFTNNNHRAWHPVVNNTGRDFTARNIPTNSSPWRAPWSALGTQTMYCSDCHGANTPGDTVDPNCTAAGQTGCGENGTPWGPHGSGNRFILKGEWSSGTGSVGRDGPETTNGLCFKCHNPSVYTTRNPSGGTTAWRGSGFSNLHGHHTDKIQKIRCSWCHAAVPHGWKNRSFLVNLNDVGPEAGENAGTEVSIPNSATTFTRGAYYNNAKLKIRSFATPGNWSDSNCGSATGQGGTGRSWMGSVCSSPP